jgi:ATP-dependent helicase/nuclease subunit B
MLADSAIHPMLRALWQPRLMEAIQWIADLERENRSAGRRPVKAEAYGEAMVAGVELYGKADRIDRLSGGELVIIDYKTGQPPRPKAVDAGFGLQLGLLGLIARAGGFAGVPGEPAAHERTARDRGRPPFRWRRRGARRPAPRWRCPPRRQCRSARSRELRGPAPRRPWAAPRGCLLRPR